MPSPDRAGWDIHDEDSSSPVRDVRLADGALLRVSERYDYDAHGAAIVAEIFDGEGRQILASFTVGIEDGRPCHHPVATELVNGRLAFAWLATCIEGEPAGVHAAVYRRDGSSVSPPRRVDPEPSTCQDMPMIAACEGGGFIVGWQAWERGQPGWSMIARRFDLEGRPRPRCLVIDSEGEEFRHDARLHCTSENGVQYATWRVQRGSRRADLRLARIDGMRPGRTLVFEPPTDWSSEDFAVEPQPDGTLLLSWTRLYLGERRRTEARYDDEGRLLSR